jgi:hypothetical protein
MLVFDPKKRISVTEAMAHPYLAELGNLEYFSKNNVSGHTRASPSSPSPEPLVV